MIVIIGLKDAGTGDEKNRLDTSEGCKLSSGGNGRLENKNGNH